MHTLGSVGKAAAAQKNRLPHRLQALTSRRQHPPSHAGATRMSSPP